MCETVQRRCRRTGKRRLMQIIRSGAEREDRVIKGDVARCRCVTGMIPSSQGACGGYVEISKITFSFRSCLPHVLDVWESLYAYGGCRGSYGPGMVSLPCGTGENCLNFTKPQKMLFYWFAFVQDSSKNKKHVCLVKDNKLSFPVIHAFHFCRKMDGREHQHFLRFWKFLRTFRRLHREEIPSPGP